MGLNIPLILQRCRRFSAFLLAGSLLAACAGNPDSSGINDPFEPTNRKIHAFNKGVDRAFLGPTSKGYGGVVPEPVQRVVGNVANTLDLPGDIVNNVLQLRLADAGQNTLRLATNLTFGIGGLFDFSSAIGLEGKPTDFGETLHVWGVGEGPYVELPLIGPSTVRDTIGMAVDIAFDPVNAILPEDEATAALVVSFLSRLGDRDRFSETVDSILYDSADSYAQARLLYLQNRRFELGQEGGTTGAAGATDDGFIDPYEDPYAE
ncbi:MAG: VacJ family lipoprotein [Tabrizicola sp.]|nr:VacJ family lipoprotein [Tabrizicola sp.]